ncbi:hypothetical protein TNCV_4010751 [Trichonephila clavipes]|nr:hypothetical protein TNCV_4010751 [Trichonephila clavipes]
MFRRILCTVLTGLSSVRATPRALHDCKSPLVYSTKLHMKRACLFEFLNHFLKTLDSHRTKALSVRKFCRAIGVHSLFLQNVSQAERGPSLRQSWRNSHKRNEDKSCTRDVFITIE